MSRVSFRSTLDEGLLILAKQQAEEEGLEGVNALFEKALQLYFTNYSTTVWEKPLSGGWLKKMIVRPGKKVVFESIRVRKVLKFNPRFHTEDYLGSNGWFQVWKCRAGRD